MHAFGAASTPSHAGSPHLAMPSFASSPAHMPWLSVQITLSTPASMSTVLRRSALRRRLLPTPTTQRRDPPPVPRFHTGPSAPRTIEPHHRVHRVTNEHHDLIVRRDRRDWRSASPVPSAPFHFHTGRRDTRSPPVQTNAPRLAPRTPPPTPLRVRIQIHRPKQREDQRNRDPTRHTNPEPPTAPRRQSIEHRNSIGRSQHQPRRNPQHQKRATVKLQTERYDTEDRHHQQGPDLHIPFPFVDRP
jgi:hypothetical protein